MRKVKKEMKRGGDKKGRRIKIGSVYWGCIQK